MREGENGLFFSNDSSFGTGVCFGYGYTAEHEWGFKDLARKLGCAKDTQPERGFLARLLNADTDTLGIESRRIRNTKDVSMVRDQDGLVQTMTTLDVALGLPAQLKHNRNVFAWSDRSFGIRAHDIESKRALTTLWERMQAGDVALTSGRVGKASGLILAIISSMPESYIDELRQRDEDRVRLQKAHDQVLKTSKVQRRVSEAGLNYFAMSPRWTDDRYRGRTKYDVVYWLNPREQHKYNAGLFTVEELLQWCEGRGPVIKER